MDAHSVILTTLTKRQLLEVKKKYRTALQEIYGMNRSPYSEETFENYILYLAKLLFHGFTSTWLIVIVVCCSAFMNVSFIATAVMFFIYLCIIFIMMVIKKINVKLSFYTVMSLLIVHWKTKVYKISMPGLD